MAAATAAFLGGPADGREYTLPADGMGRLSKYIQIDAYVWHDGDDAPTRYSALYQRTLNPADDGPLWVYLFQPADDGPVLSDATVAALDPSQVDSPGPGR